MPSTPFQKLRHLACPTNQDDRGKDLIEYGVNRFEAHGEQNSHLPKECKQGHGHQGGQYHPNQLAPPLHLVSRDVVLQENWVGEQLAPAAVEREQEQNTLNEAVDRKGCNQNSRDRGYAIKSYGWHRKISSCFLKHLTGSFCLGRLGCIAFPPGFPEA